MKAGKKEKMTSKEKTSYKKFAQERFFHVLGFAPALDKIILLEASYIDGRIDYVFCQVKERYYRMGIKLNVIIVTDDRGSVLNVLQGEYGND